MLEGVSHFLCVAHHATHDRQVSLLTLELQAEIDKYVGSFLLLSHCGAKLRYIEQLAPA